MRKRLFFRTGFLASLIVLAAPAFAQGVPEKIDSALEVMEKADTEEAFMRAAQDIVALGVDALPVLTERLKVAEDEDDRVQVTYLLASIAGQAKFQRTQFEVPPDLVPQIAELLKQPADLMLEANLANLAAFLGPHAEQLGPGLLALLERTEREDLRATTSAAIGSQGDEVVPFVSKALLASTNDAFSADLARILNGADLDQETTAKLQSLLKSDNMELREMAARTLRTAGIEDPALLEAALRDLQSAQTEMQLSRAVATVMDMTDGSEAVAKALQKAFEEKAGRIEERRMIVAALDKTGDAGLQAYRDLVESAPDTKVFTDITMGIPSGLRTDPRFAEILIGKLVSAQDDEMAKSATFALAKLDTDVGLATVEERLGREDLTPAQRKRLQDAIFVAGWKKNGAQ